MVEERLSKFGTDLLLLGGQQFVADVTGKAGKGSVCSASGMSGEVPENGSPVLGVGQLGDLLSCGQPNFFCGNLKPDPLSCFRKVSRLVVIGPIASLAVGDHILTPPGPVLPGIVGIELEHDLLRGVLGVEPDVGEEVLSGTESYRFAGGIYNVLDQSSTLLAAGDLA